MLIRGDLRIYCLDWVAAERSLSGFGLGLGCWRWGDFCDGSEHDGAIVRIGAASD